MNFLENRFQFRSNIAIAVLIISIPVYSVDYISSPPNSISIYGSSRRIKQPH
ncbi:hypothetical protein BT63DRAFT_291112 [Microthyrium microscopicum]|uniref:Uncharacterized protein n=1 Tax=Microthyrium microscopicum TaxID=703497 RepID=A0A6A6U634_9PEZI|nr:hypothetical protein BT63DRAFT_291112 [Microthyrium microscopicum]